MTTAFKTRFQVSNLQTSGPAARLATHDASIARVSDECTGRILAAEESARNARRAAEAGKIDAEVKLDAALTELADAKSGMFKAGRGAG